MVLDCHLPDNYEFQGNSVGLLGVAAYSINQSQQKPHPVYLRIQLLLYFDKIEMTTVFLMDLVKYYRTIIIHLRVFHIRWTQGSLLNQGTVNQLLKTHSKLFTD